MTVDLVIAAYAADLGWLKNLPPVDRLFIYDKADAPSCPPLKDRLPLGVLHEVYTLPNRGKCDATYLHHIVEHYDDLADWTVFSPDHPFDHLGGKRFEDMLRPGNVVRVPWLCKVRDWGPDGRLQWHLWTNRPKSGGTNWAEWYASGRVTPARLSFPEWAWERCGIDMDREFAGYHPGGILGVPRAAITAHLKAMYAAMRDDLSHSVEPEEGHYAERLWVSLFR